MCRCNTSASDLGDGSDVNCCYISVHVVTDGVKYCRLFSDNPEHIVV